MLESKGENRVNIKSNSDGSKWIQITKTLFLWRTYPRARIKFICWKVPGLKKFYGLKNCRFCIHKGYSYKPMSLKNLRVFIRLPFFYWDKSNNGWELGLPNLFLWWRVARIH